MRKTEQVSELEYLQSLSCNIPDVYIIWWKGRSTLTSTYKALHEITALTGI